MIVYNKAMHLDNLHNNCVYPIQCCMNGISVNRVPEFLADNPDYSKNVLLVDEPLDNEVPLITPLYLISVAIYYPVINPIIHESNDDPITHTHVTAEEPLWDPWSSEYYKQKEGMMNFRGQLIDRNVLSWEHMVINLVGISWKVDDSDFTNIENSGVVLYSNVSVSNYS